MTRIYRGWFIVLMAMVIAAVLTGSTFSAFGVFVVPVSAELGLSRATMNTALILKNLGNAVWAPIIGRLLDKVRARYVMAGCAITFALSFIVLGLSHSLLLSAAIMAVGIPIAYLGAGSLTNTLLIARWFTARRGRAMLLAGIGSSIGASIGAPGAGYLIEHYGWRMALVVTGVLIGALLLVLALIVRERPAADDVEIRSGHTASHAVDLPLAVTTPVRISDLFRMRDFWVLGLATALFLGPNQALIVSLVPLGLEAGLSTMQAAGLMSVLGALAIISALSFSIVADRINRVIFLACLFVTEALTNAALLLDTSYVVLFVCAGVVGIVGGTLVHTFYALLADRFGTASFGTVRGATFMLVGMSGMVAVRYSGEVYDRTGSYDVMFGTFSAVQLGAAALMLSSLLAQRSRAPARIDPTEA